MIDLSQIEDEQLKKQAWAGVVEFALKHVFARDILPHLQDMAGLLHDIAQRGGGDLVSTVLQYLLRRGKLKDEEAFLELVNQQISPEVGDNMMTFAERLRAEGMERGKIEGIQEGIEQGKMEGMQEGIEQGKIEGKMEGKTEGKIEVIEHLLAEKMELAFIAKVTGLPLAKIREIQKKAFVH